MADYIYTMETRLSPEQMRTVLLVQQISKAHGLNVYLTGGVVRDILTGFPIRDLDFTVQGNPLSFQQEIAAAGGIIDMVDTTANMIHVVINGTRAEIGMARAELFDKPGKPPAITPATINEDLRRRDFTANAMALSLNDGSRGLLLDPFNGAADIEARLLRVLHSYAFLEDPSRLIRATRFSTRFGWELEEKTRARYDAAIEGEYIQFISNRAIGYEIEQIAHEENPIAVMRALEEAGWLTVLCSKWSTAKADTPELAQLLKTRATMGDYNISVDAAPAVMKFLTQKLSDAEVSAIEKLIPHREFVSSWKRLDEDARELSKLLLSKEASSNSGAWKTLAAAKPEALLYLEVTGHNKTVDEKIKNFLGKWRQVQEQVPVAKMAEMRITPQLPEYQRIWQEAFLLLLDGKLRSEAEVTAFLAPFEPPPPPPPPTPVRRGRAAAKKSVAAKPVAAKPVELAAAAAEAASAQAPAVEPAAKPVAKKAAVVEQQAAKAKAAEQKVANGAKQVEAAKALAPAKAAAKTAPVPAKVELKAKPAVKAPAKKAVAAKAAAKVAAKKPAASKPVKNAKPAAKVAKSAKPVAKVAKAVKKAVAPKSAPKSSNDKHSKSDKKQKKHR